MNAHTSASKAVFFAALVSSTVTIASPAYSLDKVRFGTDWLAEADHGGFYQAVADGTYAKYGLDVEIQQGGPGAQNRALLLTGKLDFYLGTQQEQLVGIEQGIPLVDVAAFYQKNAQVILAHPNSGVEKFEDLAKLETIFMTQGGFGAYFEWMKANFGGFRDEQYRTYSFSAAPFLADKATATTLPQNELLLADAQAVWNSFLVYGEDIGGYIAHGEVQDAAFCIEHTFFNGDAVEYRSPLIIGGKMDPTQICEPFAPATIPTPPAPQTPPPGSKGSTPSGNSGGSSQSGTTKTGSASASTAAPNHRARNFALIEKNRRAKTAFPATPSSSGRAFGAFITSCLPDDAEHRADRKFDFEWQLEWWRRMTDIPVYVIASNWTDEEIAASKELGLLAEYGGGITRVGPRILIENRIDCLKQLYASDFDWGIIMDDDAVLMQAESHNSSYRLFAEMAAKGKDAYDGVDVFAPIYGRKVPFNKELNAPGNPYTNNHVFKKSTDLKGSMIVVRNFEKEGRKPLLPDPSFRTHGEDTYLVLQAVSLGYSSMTCWNMVLEELSGESTFANGDDDRTKKMRKGHELLVEKFGQLGLRMKAGSHSLDKKEFETACWGAKPKRIEVAKPL